MLNDLVAPARRGLGVSAALVLVGAALSMAVSPRDVPSGGAIGSANQDFMVCYAHVASRNLLVAALIVAGSVTFGILSAVLLLRSGWAVGDSLRFALGVTGSWSGMLSGVLTHGLLEVAGLCFAGAAAYCVARSFWSPAKPAAAVWCSAASAAAILGAAAIECGVTPVILKWTVSP